MLTRYLRLGLIVLFSLLLLLGCAKAPPPTPVPPTPEPPPGVTLEDLSGLWTSSHSFSTVWHFQADGAADGYSSMAALRLDRPYTRLRFTVSPAGIGMVRETGGAYLNACWADPATYTAEMASPETILFARVEDTCSERSPWFSDVTFTRAVPLETALGTWEAQSEAGASLTIDEDLMYRVEQSNGSGSKPIEGTVHWFAALKQFELQGLATSACGASAIGKYTVDVDTENQLTFELVEDRCKERQQALVEWGPYSRSE
jgi:hypothetical protein